MPETQLGAHTVRSHGLKVLRLHMHDWLILVLLGVIELVLNFIEPFHRFVGEDMMADLKYPFKPNTIPFWAVPLIAVLLPFIVIQVYYFIRKDVYDLHHAMLGLLYSVLVTGVITDAIKDAVGRPRPDFYWRCFPDGKGVFDHVTKNVMCTGNKVDIREGHKSFPSGHTSWSFAGLGFLALYLSGKIRAFDRRGHVAKICIVFLPLIVAALVGVSLVDDYWHHWQDVFGGALIGITVSCFCYLQFFLPPYDTDAIHGNKDKSLEMTFSPTTMNALLYSHWSLIQYTSTLNVIGIYLETILMTVASFWMESKTKGDSDSKLVLVKKNRCFTASNGHDLVVVHIWAPPSH